MVFLSPIGLGAQRPRYIPEIDRGSTMSAAKHNTGMLMSTDSLVWSTSNIARDYEYPLKMRKVGTHVKYMLYAGCGASLTTRMVFYGLQRQANTKQMQGTVLSAKEGIVYAKKVLGWSYKNLRYARQSSEVSYTQVMLASYEEAGVEVDEVEGEDSAEGEESDEDEGDSEDEDREPFKFDADDTGESGDENAKSYEKGVEVDEVEGEDSAEEEGSDEGEEHSEDEGREPFKFDDDENDEVRDENSKKRKLGLESEGSDENAKKSKLTDSEEEIEVLALENDEHGVLAAENDEERKIGVRKLYLSTIRSDDDFEPFRKLYADIVEDDEGVDDVPVQPPLFDPVGYFASEAFQASSVAGLYVADHEVWYSIPDVTVKGSGKEVGHRYLKENFLHGNNQQQAVTILQDGMVEACLVGGSGGTIRVCHIDRQNTITDIASDTLEDLQASKQRRLLG